jgi:isocitrate dehydrogenase kinase/phosphatase
MIDGFNRHYRSFAYGQQAKLLFEAADWKGVHDAVRERIRSYDDRVSETAELLCANYAAAALDDATWQQLKLFYIGQLINHKQPELAETFFNSVCTKILHRTYFNNDYIFARPAVSTAYIQSYPPTYRSYYPAQRGLRRTVRQIIVDFDWQRPFENLDRDVDYIMRTGRKGGLASGQRPRPTHRSRSCTRLSIATRGPTFLARRINGHDEVPVRRCRRCTRRPASWWSTPSCSTAAQISILFSLSRAYFMVDMEVPSGYVQFLRSIMPHKPTVRDLHHARSWQAGQDSLLP